MLNIRPTIGKPGRRSHWPANNFSVLRMQREVGLSSYGWHLRQPPGFGQAKIQTTGTAPTAFDANVQVDDQPSRLGVHRSQPTRRPRARRSARQRLSAARSIPSPTSCGRSPVATHGRRQLSIQKSASRAARLLAAGVPHVLPAATETLAVDSAHCPHISYSRFRDLQTDEMQSENWHIHPFEIQPRGAAGFCMVL